MSDLAKQPNGPWFNQLGSCLDLTADEDGTLAGIFRSAVGSVDGGHPVSGFFPQRASADSLSRVEGDCPPGRAWRGHQ
jgi:Avidin family